MFVPNRYDLRRKKRKRGNKVQSVEEIMHGTDEKRGFQSLHLQFRIYDAPNLRYVNFPGEHLTVNLDGPKEVGDAIREVRKAMEKMVKRGEKK